MAQKRIMVYIEGEGGGNKPGKRKYLDGEFRKAWGQFMQPLAKFATDKGVNGFQCIPGRGGSSTTAKFANPLPKDEGALRVLLIDSEKLISDTSKPWKATEKKPPNGADDRHLFLMVQCLESWLMADVEGLRKHYDKHEKCFEAEHFKAWPHVEKINRKDIQKALEKATAKCKKPYAHADGNLLIGIVNRELLMKLSSVERLFTEFQKAIEEYAATG